MTELSPLRSVLKVKDLRRLELGYLLAAMGEFGTWVAILVYAHQKGGAALVGLAAVVQLLPAALFTPVIAAASDRNRRDLPLRLIYMGQALAFTGAGWSMLTDQPVPITLTLAAVAAILVASTRPAHGGLVPDLANRPDEVTAANVVTSTADAAGVLLGPALAGLVMIRQGPSQVFLVFGLAMALATVLIAGVRGQMPMPVTGISARHELTAGILALRSDPGLRGLVVMGASYYLVVGAIDVLVVILAVEVLGWGDAGAGALASAVGLGALVGALAASAVVGRRLSRALLAAVIVAGVPLVLLGWFSFAALVLLFVTAAGLQWIDLIVRTFLQRAAPASALSRVLGVHEGLASVSLAVGSLVVSVAFSRIDTSVSFTLLGLLLPLVAVALWKRIKRLERDVPVRLEELRLLKGVPLFRHLSPLVLESLAGDLVAHRVEQAKTLIEEGEEGDSLYLVGDGEFMVEKSNLELARLGEGDIFGEIALLYDVPRTATVRTLGPARFYTLDRQRFLTALGATGEARTTARHLADQRLREQD